METIIYGLCAAVVLMWLANAIRFYQNQYKHKFYKHIYSNFFEYYYKFSVKHDASVSSYIKNRIGANRIVFNSYLNEKYVPVHELVTIITTNGVLVCYIINSIGEVSGKDSDKHLIVKHDNKRFKIKGPKEAVDKHIKAITDKCGELPFEVCYFFKKGVDFSGFKTDAKRAYYQDAIKVLEEMDNHLSDEQVEIYYKNLTSHLVKEEKNA